MIPALALSLALGVCPAIDTPVVPPVHEACSKARAAFALAERRKAGGGVLPADLSEDPTAGDSDLQHDALELDLDTAAHRIVGRNVMTIRALPTDGLHAFRFRLDSRLSLDAVRVGGVTVPWVRVDDESVEVTFDPPIATGHDVDLEVKWSGQPIPSDLGGIVFDTHRNQPFVWTLSEPWGAYTWWAVKDDNRDKRTVDVAVTVPSGMDVASNGSLVGTEAAGTGRTRFRWSSRYPIAPYLVSIAAMDYQKVDDSFHYGGETMPVVYYLYPDQASTQTPDCRRIPEMLSAFSDRYGLYPFFGEKYGIYQFSFGGGMEHQTMTGQWDCSEMLSAHELAHQWWGDMVTCATWHDIWLNEGFATYSEAVWRESQYGEAALDATMDGYRPRNLGGTVYVDDISDVNRIFDGDLSYAKGGWVLHMLRNVVGDRIFFDTLALWRERFLYASGTTEDFRAVAEEVAGRPLDWFFDEWVYRGGAPSWRWGWRGVRAADRDYLELHLRQVQSGGWPTFTMPIDLAVTEAGGTETVRGWNDARDQYLLIPLSATAGVVAFDPKGRILDGTTSTETFLPGPPKIVESSPVPGGVVPAGTAPTIRVVFHDDVVATAASFSLVGAHGGTVATAWSYDAASRTASLVPSSPLPPDDYTLTVDDAVVSVASGQKLDGELSPPFSLSPLPSGDGIAGGKAVIPFRAERPDLLGRPTGGSER